MNEENDIIEASTPDEFFVCAYQVGDVQKQEATTPITKFDCNEGDILGNPTKISLFKSGSQVYSKSQVYYQAQLNTINITNSDTVKIKILAPLADKKDTAIINFSVSFLSAKGASIFILTVSLFVILIVFRCAW